MGKIKKLHQGALVGEGSSEEVYPVTAAQAVYHSNGSDLETLIDMRDPVSVSQDAGTGKTTITVGSDSYDVATEPVSVSQNTSTGHTNINIGDTSSQVASVDDISNLNRLLNEVKQVFINTAQINNVVNFKQGYKYSLKFEQFDGQYADMYYKVDDETAGVKIKTFVCDGSSSAYEFTAPVDAKYLYFTISGETIVSVTPVTGLNDVLNEIKSNIEDNTTSIGNNTTAIGDRVVINSSNLYDLSKVEDGYWLSSSGNKNYTPAWVGQRGLIKVEWKDATKITVNCQYTSGGTYSWQFDDQDNVIADTRVEGAVDYTFTKATGAKYLYLSVYPGDLIKQQINYGDSLLPYSEYNPISGYLKDAKTIALYAYSKSGTNDATHFYGTSSIQDAINTIPDNSNDNYIIYVQGNFYLNNAVQFYNPSDYNEYYYGFYVSPSKKNITIIGEGISKTKFVCSLADNLGASFPYDKYITAEVLGNNCKVIGMTISARNMRYAVHLDRSGYNYCNGYHITYQNCKLVHEGNTNDAATVWGATPSPFGLGISDGMTVSIKECVIEKKGGTVLYCHDNNNFKAPYLLEFDGCTLVTDGAALLTFANLGSNVEGIIKITNCHNYFGGVILAQLSNDGLDVAEYSIPKTRIITDDTAKLHYQLQYSNDVGKVLRFRAGSVNQSIRIDDTTNGYNTIIRGKDGSYGADFNGVVLYNGYYYLDGAADYAGWAMGSMPLDSGSDASMQNRLGDCTTDNKILKVKIDGDSFQTITFDKDYTSYSDADMLDEINSQLTGITAELYWLASDYYPETPSLLTCKNNESGVTIKKGMGVTINGGLISRATSNDNVNAIALDDIQYGRWGRVLKKGVLNTSYYDYNVVLIENDSKNYGDGAKFSIGATPGVFVRDDANGILRIHQYSNIIVDL